MCAWERVWYVCRRGYGVCVVSGCGVCVVSGCGVCGGELLLRCMFTCVQ